MHNIFTIGDKVSKYRIETSLFYGEETFSFHLCAFITQTHYVKESENEYKYRKPLDILLHSSSTVELLSYKTHSIFRISQSCLIIFRNIPYTSNSKMNSSFIERQNVSFDTLENSTDFLLNELNENLYGTTVAKVGYGFMLILNHFLGPILLSGIVLFEMNGGDPQKRNLINMLHSIALINLIIFSLLLGGCKLWRQIVGLIEFDTIVVVEWIVYTSISNIVLLMDAMTFLKYLHIIVWKRVKGLNDGFLALFLGLTILLTSLTVTTVDHISYKTLLLPPFKMMAGNSPHSFEDLL